MKRIISILSVLLTVAVLLCACNGKTPPKTPTPEIIDPDKPAKSDPYTPNEDLSKLDFGDREVRILQCEFKASEFDSRSEQKNDIVGQSLFARNAAVEKDLGVQFKFSTVPSDMNTSTVLASAVELAFAGCDETNNYHIIAQPSYYVPSIMIKGHYANIANVPNNYIDLEKLYWSQKYVEASVVNGRYFFVTGELATSILDRMEVVFVNQRLASDYFSSTGDDDLYSIVMNREWTYEKMLQMLKVVGNSETKGMSLELSSYSIDGFLQAMKLDMLKINEVGIPTVNVNTSHNDDLISVLRKLYYENEAVTTENAINTFASGNAIFTVNLMDKVATFYENNIDFIAIPIPMWDSLQEDYVVATQDQYTILSMMENLSGETKSMLTAVLEDLCYRSHSTTYPATYEKIYQTRYSTNEKTANMFDFLFQHLDFSLGYVYSNVLGNCKNVPRNLLYPVERGTTPNVNAGITSTLKSLSDRMDLKIEDFIKFFFN